jgi:carbonic anhydrase/acetyltransferase-like protein (isoleucine patch superfamily)
MTIGPGTRILYGARLIGEGGGKIRIGANCIIMENAVVRAAISMLARSAIIA